MAEQAERAGTNTYPCQACGSKMFFDPKSQSLKCESCGSEIPVQAIVEQPNEYALDEAPRPEQMDWGTQTRTLKCSQCGAESVVEAGLSSQTCPFCGSPHVDENQAQAGIAPESLIPFSVSRKQAEASFRAWLKKRWMAPRALSGSARGQALSGVYLPYWTYDSDTCSHYSGEAGHHYYVTETYTEEEDGKTVTKTRQVQRTRWVPAFGQVSHLFDDVLVNGSGKDAENLSARVLPFDLSKLARYRPEFLSGFLAEKSQLSVKQGWEEAKQEIDADIEGLCRDDILSYADEARVHHVSTDYGQVRYKLTLLPVWLSSYQFKGKRYAFVVNGQTGKVGGQAPVSPAKVALIALAVVAVVALAVLLLGGDAEAAALLLP